MYSQLTTDEIAKLSINKASGAAWAVYSALSAHAWTSASVFPSIQRISEVLANAYSKRSIYSALSFLEKIGLIVRKKATIRERFTLVLKKAGKEAKRAAKEAAKAAKEAKKAKEKVKYPSPNSRHPQYKKRTEKERLINQSKLKKQQIKNNHFPDYERPPVHEWLEECLLYIEGTRKEKPSKICRQTAVNALNSNDAVACMIVEGGHKDMALSLL